MLIDVDFFAQGRATLTTTPELSNRQPAAWTAYFAFLCMLSFQNLCFSTTWFMAYSLDLHLRARESRR